MLRYLAPLRRINRSFSSFCVPETFYKSRQAESLSPSTSPSFWLDIANGGIDWETAPTKALSITDDGISQWFPDGTTNMSYNSLDRHVERGGRGSQTAIAYYSAVGGQSRKISYEDLLDSVSRFAGSLTNLGVEKGDRVLLYMPMVPETVISMLACSRIGAVHSVVFGGFAANELAVRINDSEPKVIITADCGLERNRCIPYMPTIDASLQLTSCPQPQVVVLQRPEAVGIDYELKEGRDHSFTELVETGTPTNPIWVKASDPLYTIYTSGTTGDPKGVLRDNSHSVQLKYSMDSYYGVNPGEAFAAFSDVGWVVGHSYIVYAPLLQGCTSILFEGKPVGTPDAGVYWKVIEEYGVVSMFTAPTALRAIRKDDPEGALLSSYDISSLRSVFVAGERADPDTVEHFQDKMKVPVIDHWWQTESGSPMCGVQLQGVGTVGGSCGLPLPGFDVQVLDPETKGRITTPGILGSIAIKLPLPPGFMPTLYNNNSRFHEAYLSEFPGYYSAGDAGLVDTNGYVHIMERTDDAINVAGHRISTGLLEETVLIHPRVPECAVIGASDELKGTTPICLFVCSGNPDEIELEAIGKEIIATVRERVGAVASMKVALPVNALPKTRSGKILRNVIRKIANGEDYKLPGTIEDASVVDEIVEVLKKRLST